MDNISVSIDRTKFSQVLRNLVSNALKFTPKKGKVTIIGSIVTEFCNDENVVFADSASVSSNQSQTSDVTSNGTHTPPNAITRRRTYSDMMNNKATIDHELGCGRNKQQFVRITITDTGPGISKVQSL